MMAVWASDLVAFRSKQIGQIYAKNRIQFAHYRQSR